jgi:hypothetical protein
LKKKNYLSGELFAKNKYLHQKWGSEDLMWYYKSDQICLENFLKSLFLEFIITIIMSEGEYKRF